MLIDTPPVKLMVCSQSYAEREIFSCKCIYQKRRKIKVREERLKSGTKASVLRIQKKQQMNPKESRRKIEITKKRKEINGRLKKKSDIEQQNQKVITLERIIKMKNFL